MHKLLPLVGLIATASISVGPPAAAEWRFAGRLSSPFAADMAGPNADVVLVGGMGGGTIGGGMGGGTIGGGMGRGTIGGGMGGGTTGGGMGGGTTGGGMGGGTTGGGMTGSGMTGAPAGNVATTGAGNPTEPAYYTYECLTAHGQCHFAAPASLRSSSLRAGAPCSCSDGLSQGQIK